MEELFDRCLAAKYIHTAEGGDYAIEWLEEQPNGTAYGDQTSKGSVWVMYSTSSTKYMAMIL